MWNKIFIYSQRYFSFVKGSLRNFIGWYLLKINSVFNKGMASITLRHPVQTTIHTWEIALDVCSTLWVNLPGLILRDCCHYSSFLLQNSDWKFSSGIERISFPLLLFFVFSFSFFSFSLSLPPLLVFFFFLVLHYLFSVEVFHLKSANSPQTTTKTQQLLFLEKWRDEGLWAPSII